MFLGKEQEEFIATLWEFWDPNDPSQEIMIQNYRDGRQIRRCKRVNAYATNTKWPWLFVSLDREINKIGQLGNGALELKTIGGYSADKWESGIPPGHIVQVNIQMLVCEYEFGEMAILKDNRDFMVYPFEINRSICDSVLEKTHDFWERVTKARQLMTRRFEAERNFNYKAVQEINAELQTVEPRVGSGKGRKGARTALQQQIKERYP
jgi:predicted phage-related endonuclease